MLVNTKTGAVLCSFCSKIYVVLFRLYHVWPVKQKKKCAIFTVITTLSSVLLAVHVVQVRYTTQKCVILGTLAYARAPNITHFFVVYPLHNWVHLLVVYVNLPENIIQ